jgi:glutathione peroxidase
MSNSLYQFKVKNARGKEVDLSNYKGKVVMVVNTASKCGFTPQFADLEELYKEYKDQGFEIIGFPSNEFAGQEPNSSDKAEEFCQINYGVSFPIMDKVKVKKGPEQNEVFKFLTNKKENGKVDLAPMWNFQKYLVDKDGNVVDYFMTFTKPTAPKVKKAIQKLLK